LILVTTYPHRIYLPRRHVSLWVVAVVGLAAALVALGTWVLVDRYAGGGGATQDATTLIDNFNTAINTGDRKALTAVMTTDVALRSLGDTAAGRDTIAPALAAAASARVVRLERVSPVSVHGDFATFFQRYTEPGRAGTFVAVLQLRDGRILRIWGFEPGVTPPFDNAVLP
jgi:ketosteroid isomerase-like protein